MKILCGLTSYVDTVLQITKTLNAMGHNVINFNVDRFVDTDECNWLKRLLHKNGISHWADNFEKKRLARLRKLILEEKPDVVLWINPGYEQYVHEVDSSIPQRIICVDGIKGDRSRYISSFKYAEKVIVFEPGDEMIAREDLPELDVEYFPLGYGIAYENVEARKKEYDVAFVGRIAGDRARLLEKVSKYVCENNLKARFCGPLKTNGINIVRRPILMWRYPHLYKVATDTVLSPDEVADIYSRSKICLNLGTPGHYGLNPRTFDIMMSGTMELMNAKEDYGGLVEVGKHLDVFVDADDCISKIDKYLKDEHLRESITKNGKEHIENRYSVRISLQRILS